MTKAVKEHIAKPKIVLRATPYFDRDGQVISEGDILAGKADYLNGFSVSQGSIARGIERDFVRMNLNPNVQEWLWNGTFLRHAAKNTKIIGNLLDNPELMLDRGDTDDY